MSLQSAELVSENEEGWQSAGQYVVKKRKKQMKNRAVVLDSGSIINLSMNGLLYVLEELKKNSGVQFFITEAVKREIIDRPINIPRFELEAMRVQKLIDSGVLVFPETVGISREEICSLTKKLMDSANHSIKSRGKWINIVSEAEISCLALSKILEKKGMQNIIAVDERTTRMLSEKPSSLEKIMSKKLHAHVELESSFSDFKGFKFVRSTELVYVAFKKGLLRISGPRALEAVLYATKFKGSSVSFEEIKQLKKL